MEPIHDETPKRIVTFASRVAHFGAGARHKDYKTGVESKAGGDVQLITKAGNGQSRCVITCPDFLPSVFEVRILFVLLAEAQRRGKQTVEFRSLYQLIKDTGKHPLKHHYEYAARALKAWKETEIRYYEIKRPRKQFRGKGREDEPEREAIHIPQVIDRLDYDFKMGTGPVRVTLNKEFVSLHGREKGGQVAVLDLDVLAKLQAPAAQNLYIYLMAYPERDGSRQPLSVQTLVRVCAWSNQKKSASDLAADLQKILDSISGATGMTYRFEKTRNGVYRIMGAEPTSPDAVSPGVRVPASNDADVKPEPRQRVRLVA